MSKVVEPYTISGLTVDSIYLVGYAYIFSKDTQEEREELLAEYNKSIQTLKDQGLNVLTPQTLTTSSIETLINMGYTSEIAYKESIQYVKDNWMDMDFAIIPSNWIHTDMIKQEIKALEKHGVIPMDIEALLNQGYTFDVYGQDTQVKGLLKPTVLVSCDLIDKEVANIKIISYGNLRELQKEQLNYLECINHDCEDSKVENKTMYVLCRLCLSYSDLQETFNTEDKLTLFKGRVTSKIKDTLSQGNFFKVVEKVEQKHGITIDCG